MAPQMKIAGRVVVPKTKVANDFFSRFLGLMGRKTIPADEALIFPRCNSIHTFFMRFAIDVVMVDAQGEVLHVAQAMRPWRLLLPRARAKHVVEMRGGRAKELGITPGVKLTAEGVWG